MLVWGSNPDSVDRFFLYQNSHTGSETYPTSYSMGKGKGKFHLTTGHESPEVE
jgi:hypothetical protein